MKVKLIKSPLKSKKFRMEFYEKNKKIKHTDFGAEGYSDFTKHKDNDRKKRYLKRHKKRENWNSPTTAGALSRWILWNKPTLSASFKHYKQKFNFK